jgi:hypothetical protein
VLGREVLGPRREDADRDLRPLVDERRDGAVAPHGDQAAIYRTVHRADDERLAVVRSPRDLRVEPQFLQLADQPPDERPARTRARGPVGDDPHAARCKAVEEISASARIIGLRR